jgi:hypothetical protein
MKEAELNRILTATQAHPAPYSSLSLRAADLPSPPPKSKKGQATP